MGTTTCAHTIFSDDGCQDPSGLVIGTYLHGLFHNENFRSVFLRYLLLRQSQRHQGLRQVRAPFGAASNRRKLSEMDPFDDLADVVKEHVDIDALYAIIGL